MGSHTPHLAEVKLGVIFRVCTSNIVQCFFLKCDEEMAEQQWQPHIGVACCAVQPFLATVTCPVLYHEII